MRSQPLRGLCEALSAMLIIAVITFFARIFFAIVRVAKLVHNDNRRVHDTNATAILPLDATVSLRPRQPDLRVARARRDRVDWISNSPEVGRIRATAQRTSL